MKIWPVMNVNLHLTKDTGLPLSVLCPGAPQTPAGGALLNVGRVMDLSLRGRRAWGPLTETVQEAKPLRRH